MVALKITVEDTESGETETRTITDDVAVIVAGNHYIASRVVHANGTQIITVKVDR